MRSTAATGEASFRAQRFRLLDPGAKIQGRDDGWLAPVGIVRAPNGFGEEVWTDSLPENLIATRIAGAKVVRRWGKEQGHASEGWTATLQPKTTPNHYSCAGPIFFAQIYLPDRLVDNIGDRIGAPHRMSGRLRDDLSFCPDPIFQELTSSYVRRGCLDPETASRVEMEARGMLLVEYLLRELHGVRPARRHRPRGGLAPWQIRKATDYLQAHLAEDVSLADLSALVDLSPFHFARAFKRSLGVPPHAWQSDLRIERAKELLRRTDMRMSDVASAIGYGDQSHFAKVFRREVGVSPTDFRRDTKRNGAIPP